MISIVYQQNAATWSTAGKHRAGATLVASKYAVTCAHCVRNEKDGSPIDPKHFKIILGDHDITRTGEGTLGEKTTLISRIHIHPDWKYDTWWENDICLLELAEEIDLTTYTPACMAKVSGFVFCCESNPISQLVVC